MLEKLYKKYRDFVFKWYKKYEKKKDDSFLQKIFKWIMRNFAPCVGWAIVLNLIMFFTFGWTHWNILGLAFCFLPLRLFHKNPIIFFFGIIAKFAFPTGAWHSDITNKDYDTLEDMMHDEFVWEFYGWSKK